MKIVPDHRLWGTGGAGPGNHLLSSPVQMANALAPLVRDPAGVRAIFGADLAVAEVVTFGPAAGDDDVLREDVVVFGWSGPDETADPSTMADAAFRYVTAEGRLELALVRWCYAERTLATGPPAGDPCVAPCRVVRSIRSVPHRPGVLRGGLGGSRGLAARVAGAGVVARSARAWPRWTGCGWWPSLPVRTPTCGPSWAGGPTSSDDPDGSCGSTRRDWWARTRPPRPTSATATGTSPRSAGRGRLRSTPRTWSNARVTAEARLFSAIGRLRAVARARTARRGLVDRLQRLDRVGLEERSTEAIEELASRVEELADLSNQLDI